MTLFGKLLAMFNLAFALMVATWSFSLYANGIDWPDTNSTRAAKLKELWEGVAPAQQDWLSERGKLANEETRLAAERVWYDKELRYVLVGPAKGKGISEVGVAPKDDPQTGVKRGQVLLDQQGYPLLAPPLDRNNNPLQLLSLEEYNRKDEGLLKELKDVMERHEKQIAEANKLTDLIIGDKAKGIRGFQQRIYDEQAKNANVLAETHLVEPQYINTLVEEQLINQRHAQMMRRIAELKKLKVASK